MKDELHQGSQSFAVRRVRSEESGGTFAPGDVIGRRIGGQPAAFAEDGFHIGGGPRIGYGKRGFGVRLRVHAGERQRGERGATTWAAMASPRPTASTPSLVLALRWIFSGVTPRARPRASRILGKCGPSLGFSVMTTASTCSMAKCFSARSLRACSRNKRLLAPF